MTRIIFHADFDYFYAALEELRNPELRGKPVVVCVYSGRSEDSGAVATANYKARELGIKSGMPNSLAKKLGKDKAVFVPTDFNYYKEVSSRIMNFFREKSEIFEQVSIDEAYLDFTGKIKSLKQAEKVAEEIKKEIFERERITCSIGIGPNKLVAKMASKEKKPDGLTVIRPEEVKDFLFPKPASKLFGVGPKSLEIFERLGIKTIKDLAEFDLNILIENFGKAKGKLLWERANGIDNEPVEDSERQQASSIATLEENTRDMQKINKLLEELAKEVHEKVKKQNVKFKTVSIIAINKYLEIRTRSKSLDYFSDSIEDIKDHSKNLMEKFLAENPKEILRRCGVSVSNFEGREKPIGQKTLGEF